MFGCWLLPPKNSDCPQKLLWPTQGVAATCRMGSHCYLPPDTSELNALTPARLAGT